jgi:hypothetical protein
VLTATSGIRVWFSHEAAGWTETKGSQRELEITPNISKRLRKNKTYKDKEKLTKMPKLFAFS